MIANCDVLITKYSSVVYVGLALGKEVYSYFDINMLKKLLPLQNNGASACNIALVGKKLLEDKKYYSSEIKLTNDAVRSMYVNGSYKTSRGKYYEI
jgi:hypothetical protein